MSQESKWKFLLRSLSLVFLPFACNASALLDVTYEDIRKNGGFSSNYVSSVSRIRSAGDTLSQQEKTDLLNSPYLDRVHTIDLSGQGIDDSFISEISQKSSLKRIINIDISDNSQITEESLKQILNSTILGSLRDLPQISGKYGVPATTIYVTAKNTGLIDTSETIELQRKWFQIEYKHPVLGTETDTPVDNAIKFIECYAY